MLHLDFETTVFSTFTTGLSVDVLLPWVYHQVDKEDPAALNGE